MIRTLGFNPRAHGGRDLEINARGGTRYNVSIHAPTGGATSSGSTSATMKRFQSTRPWGARHDMVATLHFEMPFQSTRPRGARRASGRANITWTACFNPRAHGGRDSGSRLFIFVEEVSIHAPTGGATTGSITLIRYSVFQSTRPRGARRHNVEIWGERAGFNPRAHGGRD